MDRVLNTLGNISVFIMLIFMLFTTVAGTWLVFRYKKTKVQQMREWLTLIGNTTMAPGIALFIHQFMYEPGLVVGTIAYVAWVLLAIGITLNFLLVFFKDEHSYKNVTSTVLITNLAGDLLLSKEVDENGDEKWKLPATVPVSQGDPIRPIINRFKDKLGITPLIKKQLGIYIFSEEDINTETELAFVFEGEGFIGELPIQDEGKPEYMFVPKHEVEFIINGPSFTPTNIAIPVKDWLIGKSFPIGFMFDGKRVGGTA